MRGTAGERDPGRGIGGRGAGRPLKAHGRTGLLVDRGDRALRSVALLSDEPAGLIATRTAGAVEFVARMTWQSPEDVPAGPLLPDLQDAARCYIAETEDPRIATRCLTAEIRALGPSELDSAIEAVLRHLTAVAALAEAMLEVGAVRTVPAAVASAAALEGLARDLWGGGFRVRFGPSWTPAPRADVCVGVGADGGLQEYLRSHPSWSIA